MLTAAVAGLGHGMGEFCHLGAETLDFGKRDQLLADDVVVEPGLEGCDLAAQGCYLRGQRGGVGDGDGSGGLVMVLLAVCGAGAGAVAGEVGDDLRRYRRGR